MKYNVFKCLIRIYQYQSYQFFISCYDKDNLQNFFNIYIIPFKRNSVYIAREETQF